jgi:hypothetical protein
MWHPVDTFPQQLIVQGVPDIILFFSFRNKLFEEGGQYTDGLAYMLIATEPYYARSGVPREHFYEQLRIEFGKENVNKAINSIELKEDAQECLYRRSDGKVYKYNNIPVPTGYYSLVVKQLRDLTQTSTTKY